MNDYLKINDHIVSGITTLGIRTVYKSGNMLVAKGEGGTPKTRIFATIWKASLDQIEKIEEEFTQIVATVEFKNKGRILKKEMVVLGFDEFKIDYPEAPEKSNDHRLVRIVLEEA
ncbi:MAG: hypothetical protein NC084_13245 [Bacteroides sp.]|nr:hypothetical protein [Eubacterium sp.]MCM1419308.1 hypothetical protein [Roseburia sp.]MCM1463662.1 hypothetical protein [Bacteroides sp.]